MKAEDLRQKTDDQLSEQLGELKREALNLRFQQSSGQLEGTARVRSVRRDIARINTILNERRRGAAAAAAGA